MTHTEIEDSNVTLNMESKITANIMTEEEYDLEREKLRETYGVGIGKMASIEARAKMDIALAKFFIMTRWDQRRIAKKEGQSQSSIANRMCFGRFLNYSITQIIELPKNIHAGRFLAYWKRTVDPKIKNTKAGFNEHGRFDEVLVMIQEEEARLSNNPPPVGRAIVKDFGDGKWHPVEKIAKQLEFTQEAVLKSLESMKGDSGTGRTKVERREFGKEPRYRIFPCRKAQMINPIELEEKLRPFLEALKLEGRKNMATMSPPTVAYNTAKIQELLNEWIDGKKETNGEFKESGLRKVAY